MISMTSIRRLGPWLVGWFLVAQIFGVVLLVSEHTAHVAATEMQASPDNPSKGTMPQGRHHHGDADGFIQHHELQDLNGTLISLSSRCEIAIVRVAITAYLPDAVAEGDPILLERPPKPILSI